MNNFFHIVLIILPMENIKKHIRNFIYYTTCDLRKETKRYKGCTDTEYWNKSVEYEGEVVEYAVH